MPSMRSGIRIAKPFITARWKTSKPCFVPTSSPYMRRIARNASGSANCTTSSAKNSRTGLPACPSNLFSKSKRQAVPSRSACLFDIPGVGETLRRRLNALLGAAGDRVLLFEAIDTSCGVHQLLEPGVERVARGADFHTHVALVSGARLEGVGASASDVDFVVSGVNSSLHVDTRGSFREFQYTRNTNPRAPFGTRGIVSLGDTGGFQPAQEAAGPQELDPATERNRL